MTINNFISYTSYLIFHTSYLMLKILLIEDNIGDVYLVKALLAQSDFSGSEIVNCVTLKEGLDALALQDFSIVLLDLSLPDSLGFDTLQQLVSNFPEATVIVMTGLGDREIGFPLRAESRSGTEANAGRPQSQAAPP